MHCKYSCKKFILIIFLLLIFIYSCKSTKIPEAVNGIIDLSNCNLKKNKTIPINGKWEFYWNKQIKHEDFLNDKPEITGYTEFADIWSNLKLNNKKIPKRGYCSYRLILKNLKIGKKYSLKFGEIFSSYTIFIDGKKIIQAGFPGKTKNSTKPEFLLNTVNFISKSNQAEIIIHVSNFHFTTGGTFSVPQFGFSKNINNKNILINLIYNVFIGILMIIGFYHLLLFILRRNETALLFFGLLCLDYSIVIISYLSPHTANFLSSIIGWNNMYRIQTISYSTSVFLFMFYLYPILKKDYYKIFLYFIIITTILIILFFIFVPQLYFLSASSFLTIIAFVYLSIIIFIIIKSIINKRENAVLYLVAYIVIMIGLINDTLYLTLTIKTALIMPFVIIIYVVLQAYLFSIKYSQSFNRIEKLSHELEKSNVELTNLNITLEKKVEERTHELKILNSEMKKKNEELKKLDNLKNDFIANITHDFRSPLTAILNIAELGKILNNNQEDNENYNVIYKASLKLKKSIDNLLDLAKMDSKGLKLSISNIDVISFLNKIVDFFSSSVIGTQIQIKKNIPLFKIKNFYTDIEKLEIITSNIISNSIKFVDRNSGEILVKLIDKKKSIIISVIDNGIGIPKEKLKIIFKRFEQVNSGRNSYYGGSGIGLAFAKQLVNLLKGKIWAESEGIGKGASFFIELKKGKTLFKNQKIKTNQMLAQSKIRKDELLYIIKEELEKKKKNEEHDIIVEFNKLNNNDQFDYMKGKILIIDDDNETRTIIKKYLKNQGFTNFIITSNGKLGLDAVYQYYPDIIICDYNMPEMRGDELHEKIITNPGLKNIPFIFLSAVTNNNIIIERRKKGACAYLNKPIESENLLYTVIYHLKNYFKYLQTLKIAITDELTGIHNRFSIMERFKQELLRRKLTNISLLIIDVDNFKTINDTFGHQAGDYVLKKTGKIIKEVIRKSDFAGRYGGDEFIIILPDTNNNQALILIEKLLNKIRNSNFTYNKIKLTITLSIGIATLFENEKYICKKLKIKDFNQIYNIKNPKEADWKSIEIKKITLLDIMFSIADEALYNAKITKCLKCGFLSLKKSLFTDNKCPKCNSEKIVLGKNRYSVFSKQ